MMSKYWDILMMSLLCSVATCAAAAIIISIVGLLIMEVEALF